MLNPSWRSKVAAGSLVVLGLAFAPHAFAVEGNNAPAPTPANNDIALIKLQLERILEALEFQGNGGLQLHVEADPTSCASGAAQCASPIIPSSLNQIPIELRFFVMRDQDVITNLEIADIRMNVAFSPEGGPAVATCALGETGCGTPDFFINKENGGYHLWVHPIDNWVPGNYALLFSVRDKEGHTSTRFVNLTIPQAPGDPGVIQPPGSAIGKTETGVSAGVSTLQ